MPLQVLFVIGVHNFYIFFWSILSSFFAGTLPAPSVQAKGLVIDPLCWPFTTHATGKTVDMFESSNFLKSLPWYCLLSSLLKQWICSDHVQKCQYGDLPCRVNNIAQVY